MTLNPCFDRHPMEGLTAGRIVISYGEIELRVAMCLGSVIGDQEMAMRTLFRLLGESARINVADALMVKAFERESLKAEYADAIGATRFCLKLRNQFAHCHWADDPRTEKGVYFATLQESADNKEQFNYWFVHIDDPLLDEQWSYMQYAAECLDYINAEYLYRTKKTEAHAFLSPAKRTPPRLHNPPMTYIPPWLDEDQRRRHLEHFQRSEAGDQKPLPRPRGPNLSKRQRRSARVKAAQSVKS
ncbi:MAG TPA: hypothetical protein VIJ62_04940 [Rhizomicrobium sp.]